jgi:hypothetical protein
MPSRGLAGTAALAGRARAQTPPTIRIGILQDASGPYSYLGGTGSIACARQAAKEVGGSRGLQVEFLMADHQNKPDIGLSIARQWLDRGVDALLEFNNSAIALAVNNLVRERDRVMLANNVGSAILSGAQCTPNMTHWTFDTAMLARSLGSALFESGGDTWYFIRADYAFGKALRDDTAAIVESKGGRIWARSPCRSAQPISRRRSSRRNPPRRRSWRWRSPATTSQLPEAIGRVRPAAWRPEGRRPHHLPAGHPLPRARDRARHAADRELLLEPRRSHARLHQARDR